MIEKGQKTKGSKSTLSNEEIYSKAQQTSKFTVVQWSLIGLSSAIAAYGLALENLIVVIGAMMLAPILSVFISGTVSLVAGDKVMMKEALISGIKSIILGILIS